MSEAARWLRVKEIFDAVVACRVEDRAALVRELCGDDHALRAEVESLLSADAAGTSIFDRSADRDMRGRVIDAVAGVLDDATRALAPGDRYGPYEIAGLLGRGGMGEVYRARDTKLNRDVALKILPDALAADSDRLARFRREAQVLASLNHPNIGHIYGLEDAHAAGPGQGAASPALVLELVEGPTLADLITRGPIAIPEALPIARQIAEALETAHELGIVHRDLKPANVKVRPDGVVKVLDFGLARAQGAEGARSAAEVMDSPTMTSPAITDARTILGTAPYMSPEQARGKAVDKRADIWAFGCVLYEMLTGRRPFAGETSQDIIAAILGRQPEWDEIPAATPASLRVLLQRCLEKDSKRRLRDIGDARIEIEHLSRAASESTSPAPPPGRLSPLYRRPIPIVLAVVVVAGLAAVLYLSRSRPAEARRYTRITDFTDTVVSPSLSPDGRMVTFKRGGNFMQSPGEIYVKLLPNGDAVQLTHDNLPKLAPVFTPDGSRIAYTTVSAGAWDTWTVPVMGGPPTRLLPNAAALTWIDQQRVLFSEIRPGGGNHMGIVTASEARADWREIYFPEHVRGMAHFSHASPDRKWVLVIEMDGSGAFQPCRLVPFDGQSPGRQVGPDGQCIAAAWSRDGRWMYFSAIVDASSRLWRQAFPNGAPEQITSGPTTETGVAVAPDGSLVTSIGMERSAIWIRDAAGERQVSSEGSAFLPRLSRDASRVFYLHRSDQAQDSSELRQLDLASGKSASLLPGWSVRDFDISDDETEVVFTATPSDGAPQIWLAWLDRRSPPREITRGGTSVTFGANGALIYRQVEKNENFLHRINRDGSGLERITSLPILEKLGTSVDGEWVTAIVPAAGESGPRGRVRVETVAFPVYGGAPRKICAIGCRPNWSPDGKVFRIQLRPQDSATERVRTILIPVPIGKSLPDLPEEGITSIRHALSLPDVRSLNEEDVNQARNGAAVAFVRRNVQRNLFRIELK